MPFQPQQLIGPYVLERQLGRGTFGEVWLAIHQDLGERRALKIPTDPRYVQQLRREGKIIYSLQHENIVRGCDMNTLNDPPYVAMEYIEGVTLRQKLKATGKLPVPEALAILRQILSALAHAHENGVLHRDLKPENVLLTATGQVKVTDFGLGKVQAEVAQSIIFSGSLVSSDGRNVSGTVQYMSPQQQAGEAPDVRDDIYAAGVIACELITGSRPTPVGIAKMLQRARVHGVVASLLEKSLEQERSGRYASAVEMMAAVDGLPAALAELKQAQAEREVALGIAEEQRQREAAKAALRSLPTPSVLKPETSPANMPPPKQRVDPKDPSFSQLNDRRATQATAAHPRTIALKRAEKLVIACGAVVALLAAWIMLRGSGTAPKQQTTETPAIGLSPKGDSKVSTPRAGAGAEDDATAVVNAEMAISKQDYAEAFKLIAAIRLSQGESAGYWFATARLHSALKNYELAIDAFRKVLNTNPQDYAAWNGMGGALAALGRHEEAIKAYTASNAIDEDAHTVLYIGFSLEALGRTLEATAAYKSALAHVNPKNRGTYTEIGILLNDKGRYEEAIDALKSALALDPNYDIAYDVLGDAYRGLKRYDEALAAYQSVVKLNSKHPYTYATIGKILEDLGRYEEAVDAYKSQLALAPDVPDNYLSLGCAYYKFKRYDEALAAYQSVIKLNPKHPVAYLGIGDTLHDMGRYEEAIDAYTSQLVNNPKSGDAYNKMGLCYSIRKRYPEAIAAFKSALTMNPNDAGAYAGLGDSLAMDGRLREAIPALERAISLDPEGPNGKWAKRCLAYVRSSFQE